MMDAAVIITGPTGAVGIALINKLIQEGIYVYAVVRPESRRIQNIPIHPQVEIIRSDLSNLPQIKDMITRNCSVFFHLGWDGTFGDSRDDMYLQNKNVEYALTAVDLANDLGCTTFIGIGSQAEYGRVDCKLSGNTPVRPETGYGIAKYCAGRMTQILCRKYNIRHIWVRILSVYGPYDGEKTMVVSSIAKLLNGEKVLFTKGEQIWDFVYSVDAAEALYLLSQYGIDGKTYCLGSGNGVPLADYINIIHDVVNPEVSLGLGEIPYSQNQVMYLCADISELQKDTGFMPHTSFHDGIKQTKEWYEKSKFKNHPINQ